MIKVLIYEDNQVFAKDLLGFIEKSDDYDCVGLYENPLSAVDQISQLKPDVVLMDIHMPEMDGVEATRIIKQTYSRLPVIMLTVLEQENHIMESMIHGAHGYILKEINPMSLLNSMSEVLSNGSVMNQNMAQKVLQLMDESTKHIQEDFELSSREKELLGYLVKGMSYKMIAEHCSISYHTVNAHVRNIYQKLHVHSATEAVMKAIKNNLI